MAEQTEINTDVVLDDLCTRIAALTKENAILHAQVMALKARKEVDHA